MSQRFTHGVFDCKACGRSTRGDRDSAEQSYCAQDWELAGWYNSMQDGHEIDPETITDLTKRIVELGGTLDDDARELLAYVGATGAPETSVMSDEALDAGAQAIAAIVFPDLNWETVGENTREDFETDSRTVYAAFHPTINDLRGLYALPVGSLFINDEGNVCEVDEVEFSGESLKCFIITGSTEDWPLDRVKLPATLMRHGE